MMLDLRSLCVGQGGIDSAKKKKKRIHLRGQTRAVKLQEDI